MLKKRESGRNQRVGWIGEKLTLGFYWLHGYSLVASNLRLKGGEIDLLVRKKNEWRIVEVRTTTTAYLSRPEDAAPRSKALQVLKTHRILRAHFKDHCDSIQLHVDLMAVRMRPWTFPTFFLQKDIDRDVDETSDPLSGSRYC